MHVLPIWCMYGIIIGELCPLWTLKLSHLETMEEGHAQYIYRMYLGAVHVPCQRLHA